MQYVWQKKKYCLFSKGQRMNVARNKFMAMLPEPAKITIDWFSSTKSSLPWTLWSDTCSFTKNENKEKRTIVFFLLVSSVTKKIQILFSTDLNVTLPHPFIFSPPSKAVLWKNIREFHTVGGRNGWIESLGPLYILLLKRLIFFESIILMKYNHFLWTIEK